MKSWFPLLFSLFLLVLVGCNDSPVALENDSERTLASNTELSDCAGSHIAGGVSLDIPAGHATTGNPKVTVNFGASWPGGVGNLENCDVTIEEVDNSGSVTKTLYSGSLDPLWAGGLNFRLQNVTLYRSCMIGPTTPLTHVHYVRVTLDLGSGSSSTYGFINDCWGG